MRLVSGRDGFRVFDRDREFHVAAARVDDDGRFRARIDDRLASARVVAVHDDVFVMRNGATERITFIETDANAFGEVLESGGRVVAPMPGQIVSVGASVGEKVRVGDVLVVLEAMKMEHEVRAGAPGKVTAVRCAPGDRVEEGMELVCVEGADRSRAPVAGRGSGAAAREG